jgi:hypothetical protein
MDRVFNTDVVLQPGPTAWGLLGMVERATLVAALVIYFRFRKSLIVIEL